MTKKNEVQARIADYTPGSLQGKFPVSEASRAESDRFLVLAETRFSRFTRALIVENGHRRLNRVVWRKSPLQ